MYIQQSFACIQTMYTYIHTHTYMYTYIHIHICIHIYIHIHVCLHIYIQIHIATTSAPFNASAAMDDFTYIIKKKNQEKIPVATKLEHIEDNQGIQSDFLHDIYIYIYIYMYVYIHIYISIHIYTSIYTYIHIHLPQQWFRVMVVKKRS
jgi:hypothetical protein